MLILLIVALLQQPSVDVGLNAGITEVRDGEFLKALFTLNDVVRQLSDRPEAAPTLARAHAYRAAVYIGLNEPERAMAAALLALKADPKIVVATPDFPSAVVRLFADPAAFLGAKPAVPAEKAETKNGPPVAAAPAAAAANTPAVIYIYWPSQFGANKKPTVLCDGVRVADLMNGRYIGLTAAPGTHEVVVDGQKVSAMLEAGHDQYFRGALLRSKFTTPLGLTPATAGDAQAEIAKDKMRLNDPKRTFNTECKPGATIQKRSRF